MAAQSIGARFVRSQCKSVLVDSETPGGGSPPEAATILVVEDTEALRVLFGRILQRAGFRVVTAADGVEALARFGEQAFDLVVTDMMMPNMDGFELIRALVKSDPGVRIIAISGVDDRLSYLDMAIRLGALAKLEKPVTAANLIPPVRGTLAMSALL